MTNQSIPFCVGLKYAFQSPSNLYFVMDFCQVRKRSFFPPPPPRFIDRNDRFTKTGSGQT
eukprot:COSAG06_NODE_1496_length_9275_cov_20.266783_3_plen_60_part_00